MNNRSTLAGIILTVLLHGSGLALVCTNGLKYLDPPPPDTSFLLDVTQDWEEEEPAQEEDLSGREPRSEEVDKDNPVDMVQKAEAPEEGTKPNKTAAAKDNGHGDVPVQAPKREEEPKLDPRASFPGMARKDTSLTAPHNADKSSDTFKAGQADGNAKNGKVDGRANAHLEGRQVVGALGKPAYNVQESGTVVVQILVDQYGNVTEAHAGVAGTTVNDRTLWNEARKEALKAKFNMKADAPPAQEGTITYRFNLK